MSLLFGEIVEPSTRALIDEDIEDYPEYTGVAPEWEGNYQIIQEINTIIFAETEKVKKLLDSCVFDEQKPICKLLNAGVEVFNLDENDYLILFSKQDYTTGQILEILNKWISTAKKVYCITSDSINNYQDGSLGEKPASIIRTLSNDTDTISEYKKLDPPNLVTGLGANVLSLCIHTGLKCTLFVAYIDNTPLDSVNAGPLLELIKKIGIPVTNYNMKQNLSSSNLYM